jgi:hypothetical protein
MKSENVINYLLLVVFVAMICFVIVGAKMADHNLAMQTSLELMK